MGRCSLKGKSPVLNDAKSEMLIRHPRGGTEWNVGPRLLESRKPLMMNK